MLCLSGFELYSRWVPLFMGTTGIGFNFPVAERSIASSGKN